VSNIARCAMRVIEAHTHHCKLERDLQLTHHAQEPFIGFLLPQPLPKITARNGNSYKFDAENKNQKCP
jgi:hypothetical protein